MFRMKGNVISVSAGDTGVISFRAVGVRLTENDRVVFTVRSRDGREVIKKTAEPEGNRVLIPFVNADTENLPEGGYEWDIRYVLDAVYDDAGEVTDGREVITPFAPGCLMVMKVVGRI